MRGECGQRRLLERRGPQFRREDADLQEIVLAVVAAPQVPVELGVSSSESSPSSSAEAASRACMHSVGGTGVSIAS